MGLRTILGTYLEIMAQRFDGVNFRTWPTPHTQAYMWKVWTLLKQARTWLRNAAAQSIIYKQAAAEPYSSRKVVS